ncbi:alpha/beta hydrolase [Mesorhizobium sp. VNQ89]|uniref:alpha/beta fold hydrolase n=1 Tax=Mesorhizobium quangtriensis TaxID=3157709 RepID=UPI0032B7E993
MQVLERGGTKLAYADSGGRGHPVVLIHGWCCDRSFFQPQFDHLVGLGHRVVALDLRGHGESDAPHGAYSMEVFTDDVAWCLRELALERPVVVGHSMGGIIAFNLAARYPDLTGAIVMIDSAVFRSAGALKAIGGICERLAGPDRVAVAREYVSSALFIATDDPVRKSDILRRMGNAPAHVMLGAMEGLRDYDPSSARGRIAVPSLFIMADEPVPRSYMPGLLELVPQLMVGQTVGSGHFCQLEVPDQVNAMLDRFISIAGRN